MTRHKSFCAYFSAYENEDRLLWDPSKIEHDKGETILQMSFGSLYT